MNETIRAAWVIGRRDFTAVVLSKAFLMFLLGPLFPLGAGILFGSLGESIADDIGGDVVGISIPAEEAQALIQTRTRLATVLGDRRYPELRQLQPDEGTPKQVLEAAKALDDGSKGKLAAVLSGSFDQPVLTATSAEAEDIGPELALLISQARSGTDRLQPIRLDPVDSSAGGEQRAQLLTGQAGQALLFLLVMLLAGMVLSNLVEEKSNKIIEILAAAVPIDSVFIGKLLAMLAMAIVGIMVWGAAGMAALQIWGPGLPNLPVPAVGWPLFMLLGVLYFAMAYLILGSLFLGIGAMASTVREVQTLSMPVTMLQMFVFGFAFYTVSKIGQPIEIVACIVPFTSPFAMLARAAQVPEIWPHFVALLGQGLFALLVVRISAMMFRRNVMKSGGSGGGLKALFGRRKTA
ncbi:ABC transporter permease [Novosphingopyxis baekryungensis]|uniref:ABC transporter permease n=1 Tax=Novosphingopyxis baekryungensis TaxID=279369 RepID=UPI0003B5AD29|nr:ABC transporter permease [Novosphingopyxis baekryungensis]